MSRKFMFWNGRNKTTRIRGSRRALGGRQHKSFRETMLGVERLEPRLVLSTDPVLTVVGDQTVDEGSPLSITNIGVFSDVVDGTTGGGDAIGLDPMAFPAHPAFDPTSNVTVDTDGTILDDTPTLTWGSTTLFGEIEEMVDVGYGSFEIAVFTFSDFALDAGITLTGRGSRPLAILSQSHITVDGIIDVSAWKDPLNTSANAAFNFAGAGGGDGQDVASGSTLHGDPAAGAPVLGGGQLGSGASGSGSGGGFGGAGGRGESDAPNAPNGLGGIAYADLEAAIQGGSGGSRSNASGSNFAMGGGGGGGIELGAVGTVSISLSGQILADGGKGQSISSSSLTPAGGGGGAGGGILVHGLHVIHNGLLSARGGNGGFRTNPNPLLAGSDAGGGGGGGEIMLVNGIGGSITNTGLTDVSGGTIGQLANGAEPGAPGNVTELQQPVTSTPIIETFDYVIDWGDGSTDDTGAATIDTPGVNIGDDVFGSFDGSHTYADDGVYVVTVTVSGSGGGSDSKTFTVTVDNVPPTATDATFSVVENSPNGTVVGTATATDPGDDTLSFSIIGGTGAAVFSIDSSGQIAVADASLLDYESTPSLTLDVQVSDGDGGFDTALVTINLINQASISGVVFVDVNQNGLYDANEPGIDGVVIKLLDEFGDPVLDGLGDAITAITSDGGVYLFEDLDPGTYQLLETQPTGVTDGAEALGSLGGTIVANDRMQLSLAQTDAFDYAFAEIGQQVASGDAATIGFWQNKHGQALISQGGTQLADWLTANFSNIFGNALVGANGSDVASFYRDQLFKQHGKKSAGPAKVDAQFMAVALATYFTSSTLAGQVASTYGFNVTDTGIGTRIVNVGTMGAAFGVADGSDRTIMQLLQGTNLLTDLPDNLLGFAAIYDTNGDGIINSAEASLRVMANSVFSFINEAGGI